MASEKGYNYNYKGTEPVKSAGPATMSPRKRRTTAELGTMSPSKRPRFGEAKLSVGETKLGIEEKLNLLIQDEVKRLFIDPRVIEIAYLLNKFVGPKPLPEDYIKNNFKSKETRVAKGQPLESLGWFDVTDVRLLKLAYYAVLDHLLDLIPNNGELSPDDVSEILAKSEILGGDILGGSQSGIDQTVTEYWPDLPEESQKVMAFALENLSYTILAWVNIEEVYRRLLTTEDDIGIGLVLSLYKKVAAQNYLKEAKLPEVLTQLTGQYISGI